jgi:NitT/TauT family transport system permease protein
VTSDPLPRVKRALLPWVGLAALIALWAIAVRVSGSRLVPSPWAVARGFARLALTGVLFKHAIASLFRVTWGFLGGVLVGVPIGLALGLMQRAEQAFNPFIQMLRPISPLAWIPIAILWFGVGDMPAIFIIFLSSCFPIIVLVMKAVAGVPPTYVNVARNFGLSQAQVVRRVILPAIASELIMGLRVTFGIAWLVVVAAEMIAVNSGLGFLIIDSRNAGDSYDQVIVGMVTVGALGLGLDLVLRRIERERLLGWVVSGRASPLSESPH